MEKLTSFFSAIGRQRWLLPVLILLFLVVAILVQYRPVLKATHTEVLFNPYNQRILANICINIMLCVSLNLVNGYMGEFSVGHAGFMSLGAYTSGVMTSLWFPQVWGAFLPSIVLGGIVAAAIGLLLALLSFKTRGDYLAIITLAFLMIVKSGFENTPYVGESRGMQLARYTTLPWAFAWMVLTIWVIRNLIYSKFGRAIIAIREDEIAANSMGVRIREAKMLAFVVSSFFAGVAGALFAHQNQFIDPSSFDIAKSTEILVMVYLGGVSSLIGSILGAGIFTYLFEKLAGLGTWRWVGMSLVLVLLMIFRPRGIMGLRELVWFIPKRELNPGKK